MIRAIVFVALVASAAAFVAPSTKLGTSRKNMAMDMVFAGGLVGNEGPEPGSVNYDPLKLSEKAPDWVLFYRESELKHGRTAMLAVVGYIVAGFVRLPGEIYQLGSVAEAHDSLVKSGPMWQLLFWVSFIEIITLPTVYKMNEKDRAPGDFGFDPLGLSKGDPAKAKRYAISELKNGRLAMLAFSGIVTQAVLTGHEFPYLY